MKKIKKEIVPYFDKYSQKHNKTALNLRTNILSIIPKADEVVKYNMPTYRLDGNDICGILINKNHIGFYPYSGSIINNFPEIKKKYQTTKGSIHIPIGETINKTLLRKIISLRISSCSVKRGDVDLTKYEKVDSAWRKIGLAAPARRALVDARFFKPSDLKKVTMKDLQKLHGMGPSAISLISKELKKSKITLKS